MQSYELLAIFPGTLAETEVGALADTIKKQITDLGAETVELTDLGKSRLAYPMKHIRYGYFRMYRFTAEPKSIPTIQAKILLVNDILRAFIQKYDPTKQTQSVGQIMSDAAIAAEAEEGKTRMPVAPDQEAAEVVELHTMTKPKEVDSVEPSTQKTEAIHLEDIDKKLDELLESDLTKI